MKATIHYVVRGKLIRYINADDIDFIEVEQKFENENPIIARDAAFTFYQSYIDVLLQSKDLKYESDKQARKELQSFIDSGTSTKIELGKNEIELSNSIGNGIGVFFVIDSPIKESRESMRDKPGDEWLIHGIGSIGRFSEPQTLMDGLTTEYNYYSNFGYAINDQKIIVNFLEEGEEKPYPEEILKTPFDWTGFDVLSIIETVGNTERKWLNRIKGGEGTKVEFKSTLRYNLHQKKIDKEMELAVAKTMAAFLNSTGGLLIVGVDDNGNVLGLENDYSLYRKNQEDNFLKEFKNIIEKHFGLGIVSMLNYDIVLVIGKKIFFIEVYESKTPIFLTQSKIKQFYVRVGTTSCLLDVEQAVKYSMAKVKWKDGNDPTQTSFEII